MDFIIVKWSESIYFLWKVECTVKKFLPAIHKMMVGHLWTIILWIAGRKIKEQSLERGCQIKWKESMYLNKIFKTLKLKETNMEFQINLCIIYTIQ